MVPNEPGGYITNCLPAPPNVGPYDFTVFSVWQDQRTDFGLSGCASFPGGNCGIFTSVSGSAPNRIFNIEWRTVLFADNNATQNHEVRLYENDPNLKFEVIIGNAHEQRQPRTGCRAYRATRELGSLPKTSALLHLRLTSRATTRYRRVPRHLQRQRLRL